MKNTLKAELHQAFHIRFFYISFFLMLAFSVFGVFFMELPRESGLTYGGNTDLMKTVHR